MIRSPELRWAHVQLDRDGPGAHGSLRIVRAPGRDRGREADAPLDRERREVAIGAFARVLGELLAPAFLLGDGHAQLCGELKRALDRVRPVARRALEVDVPERTVSPFSASVKLTECSPAARQVFPLGNFTVSTEGPSIACSDPRTPVFGEVGQLVPFIKLTD